MSEDKNQQKTGKQLLNDTQEAAERAHLLREMNPTSAQLETELKHEKRKHSYNRALRSTLYTLLVVAAAAVLIATMVMPILQITGTSMTPVVGQGEITMVVRGSNPQRGDIIAFYYNNKVLIKRVIGLPGEWVNIDGSGNVYINGELLDELYITDRALGDCSITLPYQVPDGRYFVLGDHRSTSRDSRSTLVGPVSEEQIMGRVTLRIWPLNRIGFLQ